MTTASIRSAAPALLIGALVLHGCAQQAPHVAPPRDVRTIDDPNAARSTTIEQPPAVVDETTVLRQTLPPPENEKKTPARPLAEAPAKTQDDTLAAKMELPFAPAIAMDPVDGAKVSIAATTPTLEYQGKIYYFTSEQNKRAFGANPQIYLKGQLARY